MSRPICTAKKTNGEPCQAVCQPDRPFCFSHDPELADRRQAGREAGGRERSNARRAFRRLPTDIRSTLDVVFETLEGVREGSILPAQAQAIASLSRAIVSLWEAGTVEQALRDLEEKLDQRDRNAA
jgi:hypothetical protein